MDDANVGDRSSLEPRPPEQDDLTRLCGELNRQGARYLVIGGFAVIHAGYPRLTGDIDILVHSRLGLRLDGRIMAGHIETRRSPL